jgi:hypothetical protein
MATHTVTRIYKDQSTITLSLQETPTGDTEINVSKQLSSGTNQEIDFAVTQANLQSLCISTSTACTVKTNSTGSPQDTISLVAGQCLVWTLATDTIGKCPFSGDVTKIYVTNASTTGFNIRALVNQFV